MPACIFLFPNALLSAEESQHLGAAAYPKPLQTMLAKYGNPTHTQIFSNEALFGPAWQQWLWMLLTDRNDLFPIAPYLWKGLGGEKIGAQLWLLSPYLIKEGKLEASPLTDDFEEQCLLQDLLNPILRKFGFKLLASNNYLFISRTDEWKVELPIWEAQSGKTPAQPSGLNANDWKALTNEIIQELKDSELNKQRFARNLPTIEGFWINGGGNDNQLPFTKIRSIQCQDTAIKGLAYACGIPSHRVSIERNFWRDVPDGDRVAVFSEFLDPELKRDPKKWQKAWDEAFTRTEDLMESIRGNEKHEPILVASDEAQISIARSMPKRSFLSLRRKPAENWGSWLTKKTTTK